MDIKTRMLRKLDNGGLLTVPDKEEILCAMRSDYCRTACAWYRELYSPDGSTIYAMCDDVQIGCLKQPQGQEGESGKGV